METEKQDPKDLWLPCPLPTADCCCQPSACVATRFGLHRAEDSSVLCLPMVEKQALEPVDTACALPAELALSRCPAPPARSPHQY